MTLIEKPCILVVDDDPALRELLTEYLGANGFEVEAVDGGEAMRKAMEQRMPEAIVLDLMLPGLSGLEVCRVVREQPERRYSVRSFRSHEQNLRTRGTGRQEILPTP